ncbi:MAG: hypothetical protein JWQ03_3242, partial [Variovorax sp.]|nr:hypothetical protein [Variovorax sp.]
LNAVQPAPGSESDKRAAPSGDRVSVKALKSFMGDEGMKSPDSEPFEVTRNRAAELRANGLVEYASEADEDADIEAQAKAAADKAKAEANARRGKR